MFHTQQHIAVLFLCITAGKRFQPRNCYRCSLLLQVLTFYHESKYIKPKLLAISWARIMSKWLLLILWQSSKPQCSNSIYTTVTKILDVINLTAVAYCCVSWIVNVKKRLNQFRLKSDDWGLLMRVPGCISSFCCLLTCIHIHLDAIKPLKFSSWLPWRWLPFSDTPYCLTTFYEPGLHKSKPVVFASKVQISYLS